MVFYYDFTPTPYYMILLSFSHADGYHPHSLSHPPGVSLLKEVVEGDLSSLCAVVNLSYNSWHVIPLLVDVGHNPRFIWI